jgi:NAD(P)-dependent dehydrogenase (short-subunit alcohol dehydrogenase family)
MRLADARCLITGCSSGIGRALATALADEGAVVFATARNAASIEAIASDRIETRSLDVTDRMQVDTVVASVGRVDVLVNNAGYGLMGAIEEIDDDELLAQYDTNVFGPWRMCRAVLPGMREQGGGTIVNISSVGGQAPFPNIGAYRSTKFAMEGMSWTLFFEVSHFGIRVLDVQPGLVASNFDTTSKRVARRATTTSPYGPMRSDLDDVYGRMSPAALEPADVARRIVDELRRDDGRYRLRIGSDAERVTAVAAGGDDAVEAYLVDELGFRWHHQIAARGDTDGS